MLGFFFIHLFDWASQRNFLFVFFKGLVGVFTHKIVPSLNGRSSTSSFLMWVAPFLQLTAWLAKVNLRSAVLFLLVTTRHPGCTGSCQPSQTIDNCSESWVTGHSAQPYFLKEKLIGGFAVVSACQHFFEWKTTRQQPAVCCFPSLSVPHSSQGGKRAAPLVDGNLKRTSTTALTHSPLPRKIRKTKYLVTILLFTQGDGSVVTGAQMTPAAAPDLRQLD